MLFNAGRKPFHILCIAWVGTMLLFLPAKVMCQKVDNTKEATAKHPKTTRVIKAVFNSLYYLNYTDRKKDRILDSPEDFEHFRGKQIASIDYVVLKPYGVSIEDTVGWPTGKLSAFANRIHIATRPVIIENELLVKVGDTIDPQLMADMERNIWDKYIYKDLKILLTADTDDASKAHMTVMVQDLMTWNPTDEVGVKRLSIGFEIKNLMGLSQNWNNYLALNYRRDKLWGFNGNYQFRNIAAQQISLKLDYKYDPLLKGGELYLGRNFYAAKTKWAGYAFASFYHETARENNFLAQAIPTNVLFNAQALWFARAFDVPMLRPRKKTTGVYKLIVSGKFNRVQYQRRPFVIAPDNAISFINSTSYMGAIGLARWDYYTEQNINELVVSEFFTKGFNIAFLCGLSREELAGERYYTAFTAAYGFKVRSLGYFALRGKWGTYIKNERPQNQVLNSNLFFFSNAINLGKKLYMRQFFRIHYNHGWNFAPNQDLYLNDGNGGVRGIFLNTLRGTRVLGINVEPNFYGRFKLFGFAVTYFAFADIAMAGSGKQNFFNPDIQQGYGLGIRIRNLKIGIDYFMLTFAYYPTLHGASQRPWNFLGNLDNNNSIGTFSGTLFDSRTMMFQNAPTGSVDTPY